MTDHLMPSQDEGGLPANLSGGDDLGMPGVSGMGGPGPSVSAPKSRVSGQVVLAGVVLALAGGAIYGMRFMGLNAAFGAESMQIDYTSEKGDESKRRFDKVMSELDASMMAVQVADGGEIGGRSFTRAGDEEPDDTGYTEPTDLNDLDRLARLAAEARQRELRERAELIENELTRLNVQGIIGGRVPAARINGQPVRVGKQIGVFTVVEITGQAVIVEADGSRYELRIGQPSRAIE